MARSTGSTPNATTAPLPALPEGWQVVTYSILRDNSLAVLGTNVDLRAEWRRDDRGMVVGDPFRSAASAVGRIWTFDGSAISLEADFPLLTPFPAFDRFPDRRWLVVSQRARDEANGRILTAQGGELQRIRLGDGIEHLKVDDHAHIWVGWFDEGVFGNDGWKVPEHEWPPSSYGLAAFDQNGTVIVHAEDAPAGAAIADCYALNVIADTAWACTYSDFPIVACALHAGSRWWPTELSGSRALAVRAPYILAAGSYANDSNRVALVHLGQERGQIVGEWRLPFQVGYPGAVDLVDGRGTSLHVIEGGSWHHWQIGDFIAETHGATMVT